VKRTKWRGEKVLIKRKAKKDFLTRRRSECLKKDLKGKKNALSDSREGKKDLGRKGKQRKGKGNSIGVGCKGKSKKLFSRES